MRAASSFRHAVGFMTVLPVGDGGDLAPDWLPRCAAYFPLVGILVGLLAAATLLAAVQLWPGLVAALLAVGASIALTGALHEDGLADTADGLLGGRTPERRLAIMKDSRLGTYGMLALGFNLALRVAALSMVPPLVAAAALVAAHGGGRFGCVCAMRLLPYGGDRAASRIVHSPDRIGSGEWALAAGFAALAALPALLAAPGGALLGLILGALAAAAVAGAARRRIGGYTGDVLGAVEQLSGTALLLGIAAAPNFPG